MTGGFVYKMMIEVALNRLLQYFQRCYLYSFNDESDIIVSGTLSKMKFFITCYHSVVRLSAKTFAVLSPQTLMAVMDTLILIVVLFATILIIVSSRLFEMQLRYDKQTGGDYNIQYIFFE